MIILTIIIYYLIYKFLEISEKRNRNRKRNKKQKPKIQQQEVYREVPKSEAEIIGEYGEDMIANSLSKVISDGFIVRNVYIPKANKKGYSEIDILLVHKTGIYCFECKNYSGGLFGKKNELYWTEYFGKRAKSYKIYNPIKQNFNHIMSLRAILPNKFKSNIFSCIVFAQDIRIPYIESDRTLCLFANLKDLYLLKKIISSKSEIYSHDVLCELHNYLKPYSHVTEEEIQNHKEQISKRYKNVNN
ncbi:NERD domain-containing protein [Clostridium perfringens]